MFGLAAFATAIAWAGQSSPDYLTSNPDTSQVEKSIENYLNRTGIRASTVTGNDGKIHYVLVLFSTSPGQPNLAYKITALPLGVTNEPQHQVILITLETNIRLSSPNSQLPDSVVDASKLGNCAWFEDGGELKCRTLVHVRDAAHPVPIELVRTAIRFINGDWSRISSKLTADR